MDVEPYSRAGTIEEVAERFFSTRELEQLKLLQGEERRERGLTLWTLKEAYMKARGWGWRCRRSSFRSCSRMGAGCRLEVDAEVGDEVGRWKFCILDYAEHRIALMVESEGVPELEVWEVRPILAAPRRAEAGDLKWWSGGLAEKAALA